MAHLDYDSGMPMSKSTNNETGACLFSVSLPPSFSAQDALWKAATAYAQAGDEADYSKRLSDLQENYTPALLDHLLNVLSEEALSGTDANRLAGLLKADPSPLSACAASGIAGGSEPYKALLGGEASLYCYVEGAVLNIEISLASIALQVHMPMVS